MSYEEPDNDQAPEVPVITVNEGTFDSRLRDLARLNLEVARIEAEAKQLKAELDSLSWSLATYMQTTGCTKKVLDGVMFSFKQRVYSKVEDKVALHDWIEENKAHDLLMAVHSSKLTAYVNEQLEIGGTTPPGVNPNFVKLSVSVKQ